MQELIGQSTQDKNKKTFKRPTAFFIESDPYVSTKAFYLYVNLHKDCGNCCDMSLAYVDNLCKYEVF